MMWLIIGIVLGFILAQLVSGVRSGRMQVRWYQWLLGLVSVVLLLLAIQNWFGLNDELQPRMASFALIAFGFPGIVIGVLALAIPKDLGRKRRADPSSHEVETA